jgi:hypothetical protein
VDGLGKPDALAESRVFDGAGANPVEKRDYAAIHAGINACEALFAMMDDELANSRGSPARSSAGRYRRGALCLEPLPTWG